MKNVIFVVVCMEMKKFFSNKKVIVSSFLLPILMMLLIIYGVTTFEREETQGKILVFCSDRVQQILSDTKLSELAETVPANGYTSFESLLSSERNLIGLYVDDAEHKITIGYESSSISNSALMYQAQRIADELNIAVNASDYYEAYISGTPIVVKNDLSEESNRALASLKPLLMMISIIAVMMVCTSLIPLATDLISGERERGTFDIFRLSGSKLSTIILGKTIFVTILGISVLLIEGLASILCIKIFNADLFNMILSCCDNVSSMIIAMVISTMELALLCSSCFVFISSIFENNKQASSYCSLGMVIISLAVSTTAFTGNALTLVIPIVNFTEVILCSVANKPVFLSLAVSVLIAAALSVSMLFLASMNVERDLKK